MTTPNDAASTEAAALANQAQEAGSPEPVSAVEPEVVDPTTAGIADLKSTLGSLSGRIAQIGGQSRQQQQGLLSEVRSIVEPLTERLTHLEERQIADLEPEQQIEYYKNRPQPAPVQQPQQQVYQPTQQEVDAGRQAAVDARAYLAGKGIIDVATDDPRVWEGYQNGMTAEQLTQVARSNIDSIATERQSTAPAATPPAPAPQTPETQAGPVPPTTQGSPIQTTTTFDSLSELARAKAEGRWAGSNDEYNSLAATIR
tara:strand:- start:464 stop:1234 length:771 start_codon:yes stop_codon:yes gene_type:complete